MTRPPTAARPEDIIDAYEPGDPKVHSLLDDLA